MIVLYKNGVGLPWPAGLVEHALEQGWSRPPEKPVRHLEELECGMSSMIDVALPVVLSAQVARIDAGYVKTKNRQGEHRWFPLRRLAACWVDDDEITMFVLAEDLKAKGMSYLA